MELSEDYKKAVAVSSAASKAYNKSCEAYRSMVIGDAEFSVAIADHNKAGNAFDVAFSKEQKRG